MRTPDTVRTKEGSAMAIVRTVEWKLRCGADEADARIRQAFTQLGLEPQGVPGSFMVP